MTLKRRKRSGSASASKRAKSNLRPKAEYHVVKDSLKNILRNPDDQAVILDAVLRAHKINIHTCQFIKLYFLQLLSTGQPLPKITEAFVTNIAKIISSESMNNKNRTNRSAQNEATVALNQTLRPWHIQHYKPTIMQDDKISLLGLSTPLGYMTRRIVTDLETNITEHYYDYLCRFLQAVYLPWTPRKTKNPFQYDHKVWAKHLSKLRKLIMNGQGASIVDEHLSAEQIRNLVPMRDLQENKVGYDIKCSPQDYIRPMYYMMQAVEGAEMKLFNLFPMRSSIVPKNIRFCTSSLVDLLVKPQHGLGTQRSLKSNITKHKPRIWNALFKSYKRSFCPERLNGPYAFDHQIETDGVSCSIVSKLKNNGRFEAVKNPFGDTYIDNCYETESLQKMNVVGIDPGKSDLIYCALPIGEKKDRAATQFRYTQDQRRHECKTKKFMRKQESMKKAMIEDKTVKQWEHELRFFNRKTLAFEAFKFYCQKKNQINARLQGFYAKLRFRQLKWYAKINRQRSEDNLINAFKTKFGSPLETIVAMGDWCEDKPRKSFEPTKGKSFRKMFKKAGYKTFLVNEFRTSCRCYNCGEEVAQHFLEVKNPRLEKKTKQCEFDPPCEGCQKAQVYVGKPYKQTVKCHGLLRCDSCETYWNRDLNGALNIRLAAVHAINGLERPLHLQRPPKNATTNITEPNSYGATGVTPSVFTS